MYGNVVLNSQKNEKDVTYTKSSRVKVWVDCTTCGETFLRRFRDLNTKHRCLPTKFINGKLNKWCSNCKTFKDIEDFGDCQKTSDKHSRECKLCRKNHSLLSRLKFNKKLASDETLIKRIFQNKKLHKNALPNDDLIDLNFLMDLWKLQNGCCYYTKVPMTLRNNGLNQASLERIDSSKAYTKQNTVWCTKAVNFMKGDSKLGDFLNFLEMWNFCKSSSPVRTEHKLIHPNAKTPTKAKETDAGHDLYSIEDVVIKPNTTINIRTGIILAVPSGYYITVEGRSSLFKSGVIPARGIIDSTYTGELIVALTNQSKSDYKIAVGDRVAQFIVHKCHEIDITIVDDFSPEYNIRGTNGYGSTGK